MSKDVQSAAMDAQDVPEIEETAIVDSSGESFDPDRHATTASGEPVFTKAGKFRKKRKTTEQKSVERESKNLGKFAAGATIQSCVIMFGDEWEATQTEFNGLSNVWANYFEAKDIQDLPPGLALTVGLSAYALSRIGKPKTKSKLTDLWKKIQNGAKKLSKRHSSLSNNRDDGDGQDDAGKTTLRKVQ